MSQHVQFVIDIEIEDDNMDVSNVDILDVDLDGVPENETEFSWSARRVE